MANDKVAVEFEQIIHADRERKKAQALAAKIFGRDRDRRASAGPKPKPGGTLASRVGVRKDRTASAGSIRRAAAAPPPPSNIDGAWTHDLHDASAAAQPGGSLASRITAPKAIPTGPAGRGGRRQQQQQQQKRATHVAQALTRTEKQQQAAAAPGGGGSSTAPTTFNRGMTIRGLAGPFVVMAQNFAPGTTAADIESAVTPVGGIVSSCRLLKTSPIVIAEIVFESKEGADNVVATFNNQTADGRVLHVYHKVGGATPAVHRAPPTAPSAMRSAQRPDGVLDGSLGFDDPMDVEDSGASSTGAYASSGGGGGGGGSRLYSDKLVGGRGTGRRRGNR